MCFNLFIMLHVSSIARNLKHSIIPYYMLCVYICSYVNWSYVSYQWFTMYWYQSSFLSILRVLYLPHSLHYYGNWIRFYQHRKFIIVTTASRFLWKIYETILPSLFTKLTVTTWVVVYEWFNQLVKKCVSSL